MHRREKERMYNLHLIYIVDLQLECDTGSISVPTLLQLHTEMRAIICQHPILISDQNKTKRIKPKLFDTRQIMI